MPNTITVTLSRAEYEALMEHLRASIAERDFHFLHAPTLRETDLRFATRTLEAAAWMQPARA